MQKSKERQSLLKRINPHQCQSKGKPANQSHNQSKHECQQQDSGHSKTISCGGIFKTKTWEFDSGEKLYMGVQTVVLKIFGLTNLLQVLNFLWS